MMRGRRICVAALLAITLCSTAMAQTSAVPVERWIDFTPIALTDVDFSEVSDIGRRVVSRTNDWFIGRSERFVVFGRTRPEVSATIDEAEHAYRRAGAWFGFDDKPHGRCFMVLLKDEGMWDDIVSVHGLRPDSVAMKIGRELYFKDDPGLRKRPDRVSHEVVHLRLERVYSLRVPLWLNEGLAGYFGWKSAEEMARARGIVLTRNRPPIEPRELFGLEELLMLDDYPAEPERARVLYRQSEELVAVLSFRLGPERLPGFIQAMCQGKPGGVDKLIDASGLARDDLDAIVREVADRCRME